MALADDIAAYRESRNEPKPCKTGTWFDALDSENQALFEGLLSEPGVRVSHLWRIAVKNGCEAAETRFRAHCRRECPCYPTKVTAA